MLYQSIASNPFFQPEKQWQIRIYTSQEYIYEISEAFDDIALAILNFETFEDSEDWYVDIITNINPEKINLYSRLVIISALYSLDEFKYEISELEDKDWLSEVEKSFKPLLVAIFYVYGSHVKSAPPYSKIALRINAGAAFGSGEHATTSGCLLALSDLAKKHKFSDALDMGCGSGILALAIAKLWKIKTIGIDIDPVSVRVSRENARNNKVQNILQFAAGNGYDNSLTRKNAKYDLIVANILARPLVKMAKQLKKNLKPNG
ncbi:MAG: 50S ribosomal protein L11 methyltransferase, partial [Pseudomonadota bacterium]